ncbi:MAG: hypothetical protein LRY73_06590 [Bacillus sp. (in: Bacteria)]|nr:hypothetical protein [Bacillus sp. (in: firmicutes)]
MGKGNLEEYVFGVVFAVIYFIVFLQQEVIRIIELQAGPYITQFFQFDVVLVVYFLLSFLLTNLLYLGVKMKACAVVFFLMTVAIFVLSQSELDVVPSII